MRLLAVVLATVVGLTGSMLALESPSAAAIDGADFDPEFIIDDALFYDGYAMSAAEIQSFLDAKIGTCLNDKCLNVAVVPFESRARRLSPDTGRLVCEAVEGGNLRVSELIYRVQVACSISAKVILATLHKEQGLITKRQPSEWALSHAMGWACPDSTGCNAAFAGLGIQIYMGTRQLMTYKAGEFNRQPGTHFITYHPDGSRCGGTTLNVRNYATAALYNYTPYQPNAAALANLNGTGDSCSSYGNRNFWNFYYSWFGIPTPVAAIGVEVDRVGGTGRIETAINVSKEFFDASTDVVYVANALNFPDALSAVPAAASVGAPLLLVEPPVLSQATIDELNRLTPSKIVVVGGEGVISPALFAELEEIAPTERHDGNDRYETSRAITTEAFPSAPTVYLATGRGFADALSASSVAAAEGAPIVLIDGGASTLDTAMRALLTSLGTTEVVIAGGTGVVSAGIEADLGTMPGMTVKRVGGNGRYDTSLALVQHRAGLFAGVDTAFLASGESFPDALAGGAAAGKLGSPLLLVQPRCAPAPTVQGVIDLGVDRAVILGGSSVVGVELQFWRNC